MRKRDDEIFVFQLFRKMESDSIVSFEVQKTPLEKAIHFHFKGIIWLRSTITVLYFWNKIIRWFYKSCSYWFSSDLFLILVVKEIPFSKWQIITITLTLYTVWSVHCLLLDFTRLFHLPLNTGSTFCSEYQHPKQ